MIGFDIGLEMSGNRDAFESMLENMHHGGRIALLGILPNSSQVNWDEVIFKGLTIKGTAGKFLRPGIKCRQCCKADWTYHPC